MRTGTRFVLCAAVAGICAAAWPAGARGQETPGPGLPNVAAMNPYEYAATVSWAMEACRRVYSPMTPDQTKAFEKAWAPAFGYPCPLLVDYLNRLIPLLKQYLAINGAMQEAALQFDEAWRAALVLKEYKSAEGVEEAMASAWEAKQQLVNLGTRREAVAYRIKDLGDPPDPRLCRARHRKLHDESVSPFRTGEVAKATGPAWVLTKKSLEAKKTPFTGRLVSGTGDRQDIDEWTWTYKKEGTSIVSELTRKWQYVRPTGGYGPTGGWVRGPNKIANGTDRMTMRLLWRRPPAVFPYKEDPTVSNSTMMLLPYLLEDTQRGPGRTPITNDKVPSDGSATEMSASVSFGAVLAAPNGRGMGESYGGWAEPSVDLELGRRASMGYTARAQFRFDPGWWRIPFERSGGKWEAAWNKAAPGAGWTMTLCFSVSQKLTGAVAMPGVKDPTAYGASGNPWQAEICYVYTFDPTGGTIQPISLDDETDMYAKEGPKPLTAEEAVRQQGLAATRQERIDFHKGNMRICELNIAKWEQELAAATNVDTRETLLRAILQAKHNWYSEMDRIQEVATGEFVHTRTPIDEYYSAKFVEECRSGMGPDAQIRRYAQGTQRLIALAPPDQRDQLRAFVARHTGKAETWGDVGAMRKISRIVFEKVQGHWEGESARSLEEAIMANRNLQYAQILKTTAEAEMFAATMGLSAMGAAGAGWVMPAFEGAVGYAEVDGPKTARVYNAIEKSLAWTNTAGLVASEAMAGYEKGGWISGKTGWAGAAERAVEAFAMVKGVEYAIGKLWGVPPELKKPTVQEAFEYARHKQAIEEGKLLVEDYQRSYREYQKAMEFGASGGEVAAMEAALRQKAGGIHATYESKLFLKSVGKDPKFAEMITDFNQRLGQIHTEALTRFRQMMIEQKFDDVGGWVFQEFRNSASAGTVGMDYDIGLMPRFMQYTKDGKPIRMGVPFTRGGVRGSPIHLREAAENTWRRAYHAVTGQSARRSFETMTSSAHPEIYTDLAWLGDAKIKGVKIDEIVADRAGQAGDVTGYKAGDLVGEMVNDKLLTRLQAMTEASRGMAKDIETKLLPLLKAAPAKVPGATVRFQSYQRHWEQIAEALKGATADPVRANEQIRLLTGGKEIPELAWDLRAMIANYGKAMGK
ncbi:MAG: hypothetical protein NTV86_23100 [Planctomycetota bacterium]|nr:hypothetical protein [Planctomycetota bacterium]